MKYLVSLLFAGLLFSGCGSSDATIASHNLSKASDNFEINRRIVFYNGITDRYILTIEGLCSIQPNNNKLAVTCKVDRGQFKKHYLGLSDNVTYFVEQLDSANVSTYHYRVTFKPQSIINDIDFRGSTDALGKAITPDNND